MAKFVLNKEDVITLSYKHSMMIGNIPNIITPENFNERFFDSTSFSETVSSFGLFGSNLNYNTFYPGISQEDIEVKDSDLISPVYRLLSECIVARRWSPTDFSKNNVLKNSMQLLVGQTVNCDHETSVGNAIGSVKNVFWQEGYQETYKGKKFRIPSGINGTLLIDAKSNPRIARGITMDPPSIHSNSVTVRFTWVKSHPKMDDRDFYNKMGSFDEKGRLICREVDNIISYLETSLVSGGADPFAKQVKDGKIVLPNIAARNYSSFSEKTYAEKKYYLMDFKGLPDNESIHDTIVFNTELVGLDNSGDYSNNNYNQKNNENSMDDLMKFIQSLFGENLLTLTDGGDLNDEEKARELVLSQVKTLVANNKAFEALKQEKQELAEKVTGLEKSLSEKEELANTGKKLVEDLREMTLSDYKKLAGEKADSNIITLIGSSGYEILKSLGSTYTSQLEEKFPLSCSDCGSKNVNRGSSVASPEGEEDGKKKTNEGTVKNTEDVMKEIYEKKMWASKKEN